MVLQLDILTIAGLGCAWLILVCRLISRRTPLRFVSVLAGAILLVGVARAMGPGLVDYCLQTGIDCVPDQFDDAAWAALGYLEHPWGRISWVVLAGAILLIGAGGALFVTRARRRNQNGAAVNMRYS
jgi:hypothetical protein